MKSLALIALLLLSGCGFVSKVPLDTTEKIMVGTMIAGQVGADGGSTLYKLSRGCLEGNPLLGELPSGTKVILTKVALAAFILGIVLYIDDHKARKIALGIGTVSGAGLGLYNATVECH